MNVADAGLAGSHQALGLAKDVKTVRISGGSQDRDTLPTFGRKLRRAFAGAWTDFGGVLVYLDGVARHQGSYPPASQGAHGQGS